MDERVVKFRVGVVVLASLIVLACLVLLFNDFGASFFNNYTLYIHFPEAPGVATDTPVRKDGILIGKVAGVKFADEDPRFETQGGVIITVHIQAHRRLRANERCRISSTILGDALLQFVPSGAHPSAEFLQNGDYLEGTVAANPLQLLTNLEGNLGEAIRAVAGAGNDIGHLARRVDGFFDNNDDQLQRIVGKTERALDGFQSALNNINIMLGAVDAAGGTRSADGAPLPIGPGGIAGDETGAKSDELRKRITTLPELMAETRDAIVEMRKTVETANSTLGNLERFTRPLGDRGEELVIKVDRSVGRLDELLRQFVLFGEALNSGEGTVGQLMHNPDLYQHLNAAACNIEQMTAELKPIIKNARIFTDKLARHPEVLTRGILKPSSGIK